MLLSTLESNFYCRCCTMVTICNIDIINSGKCLLDCLNLRSITDLKDSVTDTVIRNKIIQCRCLLYGRYHITDLFVITVCQKDRSGLCAAGIHMVDTVGFLIGTCILMLFDHVVCVIIDRSTGNDSGLYSAVHRQFIHIIRILWIADKGTVIDPLIQHLMRLLIDTLIIGIYLITKLCLCTIDCKKRLRICGNNRFGLRAIVYIVRKRCDFIHFIFCGSDAEKWFYLSHKFIFSK